MERAELSYGRSQEALGMDFGTRDLLVTGAAGWLGLSLVKAVVEEDLVDEAATAAAPEAFAALKAALSGLSWDALTARTGVKGD